MIDEGEYIPMKSSIDEMEDVENVPWIYRWSKISHYYGDTVRQLMIAAAALMLIAAPYYTDDLSTELPFIVVGTVILVCVAALTSPWKRGVISADAIASGVGLVIFEMWALLGYSESAPLQFVLREALAILFLFALYFSTKTLRSMLLHQIGQRDSRLDFGPKMPVHRASAEEEFRRNEERREMIHERNERTKEEYQD